MTSTLPSSTLEPWDSIFPKSSQRHFSAGEDIVSAGAEVDQIFLVAKGAVVETRKNDGATSHAVNLSGPGSLIGLRMTSTGGGIHEVRATALVDSTLMSLSREEFLHHSMRRGDLSAAIMHDLARRTEVARRLSDSCNSTSTGRHVLDVLEIVLATFGQTPDGVSIIAVPPALLERMTGCPWLLIRKSLAEMQGSGQIELGSDGVRARAMVS